VTRQELRAKLIAGSTAEVFASMRAIGAAERDSRIRHPDHLAARFVGRGLRLTALSKVPGLRGLMRRASEHISPGAYYYELGRGRHMDAILAAELARGLDQLVILGAGFDSRAYRFEASLRGTRVFEVDHPTIAVLKRERVEQIFGGLPGHVTYAAIDFDTQELASALDLIGYSDSARTLFIWSGVSGYLTTEGVESVLSVVARGAPGSSIVFDYWFREAIEGNGSYYGIREASERVERMGEPYRFGIQEGQTGPFLESLGLELVEDVGPAELESRYLVRSDGTVHGRPCGFLSIAYARVPERPRPSDDSS
jgi:methyltransferase (TIGR00027 family)